MSAATEACATEVPENVNVFQIGEVRTEMVGLVNERTADTTSLCEKLSSKGDEMKALIQQHARESYIVFNVNV